jgi:sugar phosphate permease
MLCYWNGHDAPHSQGLGTRSQGRAPYEKRPKKQHENAQFEALQSFRALNVCLLKNSTILKLAPQDNAVLLD